MTRLQEFLKVLSEKGAKTYYVGGYVRDMILGKENKDIDIEIHYITEEEFLDTCKSFDLDIKLCGQAFGVYKAVIDGQDIDFSFPRTEKLIGTKHTDFEIAVDPFIGEEEASLRRDFTINALMMDTQTETILDFHQGMKDLEDKIIRHTSDKFSEGALRVYRAAQFASRFSFAIAPETLELCKKIDVTHLPHQAFGIGKFTTNFNRLINCRDIVTLTLVHDDDKEEEFYVTYEEDELRCYNKLQSVEFDSYENLVIKIGKDVCSW